MPAGGGRGQHIAGLAEQVCLGGKHKSTKSCWVGNYQRKCLLILRVCSCLPACRQRVWQFLNRMAVPPAQGGGFRMHDGGCGLAAVPLKTGHKLINVID